MGHQEASGDGSVQQVRVTLYVLWEQLREGMARPGVQRSWTKARRGPGEDGAHTAAEHLICPHPGKAHTTRDCECIQPEYHCADPECGTCKYHPCPPGTEVQPEGEGRPGV